MAQLSIANVLEKPFGRDLTAEAGYLGEFVDLARHRVKLGALQIAALGVSNLIRRAAPFHLAVNQVGKRHAPIRQGVAVLAPIAAAIAIFILLRARLIADMLGVGGELGMADGRRGVAEAQVNVDSFQALGVRLPVPPTTTMWVPFSSSEPSVTSTAESVSAARMCAPL